MTGATAQQLDEAGIAGRVDAVCGRIAAACARAGRKADTVQLVAVTKTFGPDAVREAASCGLRVFGESRVQEARQKIPLCPGHLEWHMIGHLQTNKVREAVHLFTVIHSVDSLRLLEAVEKQCAETGRTVRIFLEVNVSGERSKFGMPPGDLDAVLERASSCRAVEVAGLMTIPPFTPDAADARPFFSRLRELRDAAAARHGVPLPGLSMGMSHDFEVAVEEGATMVRVGTVLFGTRSSPWRPVADVAE